MKDDHAEATRELMGNDTECNDNFERSDWSRIGGLVGLGLSWLAALGCIAAGAGLLKPAAEDDNNQGWLHVSMSERQRQIMPLFLNIIILFLTESLGLVHSTTLRWAIKDRLTFNANLRLFTVAQDSWAFGRTSNVFGAGFLALCYCASSLILAETPRDYEDSVGGYSIGYTGGNFDPETISYSPSAILALGIGLMGAAAITTWQFAKSSVPTWSTSPIENAWASVATGQRLRSEGRCLMSVHEAAFEGHPNHPQIQQKSAWSSNKEVRRVMIYLWILPALSFAVFGIVLGVTRALAHKCDTDYSFAQACPAFKGPSWSFLPDNGGLTSLLQLNIVEALKGDVRGDGLGSVAAGMASIFVIILVIQSFVTMGLHCTELIVNVSRDESTWRETYTKRGYKPRNAIITVLTSPKSLLLLILKPFIHWVFGLGVTLYDGAGIFLRPPQLLYLSLVLTILALFATYLAFKKLKGPQPATFGHLQTLIDLIDVYGHPLYWGHKFQSVVEISHFGTATTPLPRIRESELYAAEIGHC